MDAIRDAKLRILVNALGGSGMNYWHQISDTYHLDLDFVNDTYDPQFTFMNYDHDGKVRMDCSSAYVMSAVTGQAADITSSWPMTRTTTASASSPRGRHDFGQRLFNRRCPLSHDAPQFRRPGIAKTVVTTDTAAPGTIATSRSMNPGRFQIFRPPLYRWQDRLFRRRKCRRLVHRQGPQRLDDRQGRHDYVPPGR